ncbi:MAG TPA: D-alanyl-D-alanine carboxypeptidase [Terriglobia bacterium]|nr:D-alanyl-D-alanine carboxypeptidase [Terriglobia bacterium]
MILPLCRIFRACLMPGLMPALVALALLTFAGSAWAADAAPVSAIAEQGFAARDIGYVLVDLADGKTIADWQGDRLFVPGSVLKLVTSLTAWKILGEDFHFTTRLWQAGDALYLQGSGDPVLTATDLQSLLRSLQATRPGLAWRHFYLDTGAILPAATISERQPLAADYNPGFGALNVDFNRLAVTPSRARSDGAWQVSSQAYGLTVPIDWVPITPSPALLPLGAPFVPAAGDGDKPQDRWWYASDSLPADKTAAGEMFLPVKQADPMTGKIFRVIAKSLGIALPEPQYGAVPADAVLLAQHDSPALPGVLQGLLRYSNNLSAELIGITAAKRLTGQTGSLVAAASAQLRWLTANLPAVNWQGFRMVNHSGLDGDNRASPRQMAGLLQAIAANPALADCLPDITASLAAGGAATEPAGLRITGKSGTMDYAAGLAGLMTMPGHRQYAYVIFMADDRQRAALDARFDARILRPAKDGRAWTLRARLLQASLLKAFVAEAEHYEAGLH